eukprot:5138244-Amphidinium_carterae.1
MQLSFSRAGGSHGQQMSSARPRSLDSSRASLRFRTAASSLAFLRSLVMAFYFRQSLCAKVETAPIDMECGFDVGFWVAVRD